MNTLDKDQIVSLLEIIDPFLMINNVKDINSGVSGIGIKTINQNEWFYKCHFLTESIMPGVLQTEAMLQTLVTIFCHYKEIKAKQCLINKSSTNFIETISGPGKIMIYGNLSDEKNGLVSGKASLFFNKKKASEGTFRFLMPGKFVVKNND